MNHRTDSRDHRNVKIILQLKQRKELLIDIFGLLRVCIQVLNRLR
jgi:hypothetical protein